MTLEPHVLRELAMQLRELAGVPEAKGPIPAPAAPPSFIGAPAAPALNPANALRPDFERRLRAVADFKESSGQLPQTGGIITAHERSLGVWLLRQRRRLEERRLSDAERNALARALGPAWMLPPGAAWWAENGSVREQADGGRSRRRNRATPDHDRHRAPWSPEEEELVLDEDLTIAEVAARLGRTHAAVRNRRQILRSASRRTW